MLHNDYPGQVCSIARSLEIVGERWTLLILRDVLLGRGRFDDLVESLGVTRTVLARRLDHLVEEGILERRAYQERPPRFEYQATEKGIALRSVLAALLQWGDAYYPHPAGPPRLLQHGVCGGPVRETFRCDRCDEDVPAEQVRVVPGPAMATSGPDPQ